MPELNIYAIFRAVYLETKEKFLQKGIAKGNIESHPNKAAAVDFLIR